jgi:ATP-dependent exoDNAse (exonuclease V) alpha subunit
MPERSKLSTLEQLPDSYEADPTIAHILEQLRSEDRSPILVTGEAGTGKSTLVNYIKKFANIGNTAVLAPTGVAALNVGGQTIHSFFRFPFQIIDENALSDQRPNRLWKKVELIVIDEISMVRADMLDGIDIVLRRAQDDNLPFGGCRVLFVGDFHQLPPVIPMREKAVLGQLGYAGPYAYDAKVLENYPPVHFELTKVYRQKDPHFVSILSDLRLARNIDAAVSKINEICVRPHRQDHMPVLLTTTNAIAERYNQKGLAALGNQATEYDSVTKGKFNANRAPAPPQLKLKKGARVMAVKNDPQKRWVNGSLGTITDLTQDEVYVKFDSGGAVRKIEPAKWEAISYKWNNIDQKMEEATTATFQQIPLILAWAVTIHKAQGLTLEDVRIDLGRGAFASGQAYVALSRARTLSGLSLTVPLRVQDIPARLPSPAIARW